MKYPSQTGKRWEKIISVFKNLMDLLNKMDSNLMVKLTQRCFSS
jgi:hypothetical protein